MVKGSFTSKGGVQRDGSGAVLLMSVVIVGPHMLLLTYINFRVSCNFLEHL